MTGSARKAANDPNGASAADKPRIASSSVIAPTRARCRPIGSLPCSLPSQRRSAPSSAAVSTDDSNTGPVKDTRKIGRESESSSCDIFL
jgi:hypothetical protein